MAHEIDSIQDYELLVESGCIYLAKKGDFNSCKKNMTEDEFNRWYKANALDSFSSILAEAYANRDFRYCLSIIKYTASNNLSSHITTEGNPYPWVKASRRIATKCLKDDLETHFKYLLLKVRSMPKGLTPINPPSHNKQIWYGLDCPKTFVFAYPMRRRSIVRSIEKAHMGLVVSLTGGGELLLNGRIERGEANDLVDLVNGSPDQVVTYRIAWNSPVVDGDDVRDIMNCLLQEGVLRKKDNDHT